MTLSAQIQVLLATYLPAPKAIELDNRLRDLVLNSNFDQIFEWCSTQIKLDDINLVMCNNCHYCLVDPMEESPIAGYCTNPVVIDETGKEKDLYSVVSLVRPTNCKYFTK